MDKAAVISGTPNTITAWLGGSRRLSSPVVARPNGCVVQTTILSSTLGSKSTRLGYHHCSMPAIVATKVVRQEGDAICYVVVDSITMTWIAHPTTKDWQAVDSPDPITSNQMEQIGTVWCSYV